MQYLSKLSPLRRWRERKIVDQHIDQIKRSMNELYARRRDEAVQALTQKNNLQNQVSELKKTQGNEELLRSAEAALHQSEKMCELLKAAIKNEKEEVYQNAISAIAAQTSWESSAIQREIEKQMQCLGTSDSYASGATLGGSRYHATPS